jgi:hypothetical protein
LSGFGFDSASLRRFSCGGVAFEYLRGFLRLKSKGIDRDISKLSALSFELKGSDILQVRIFIPFCDFEKG